MKNLPQIMLGILTVLITVLLTGVIIIIVTGYSDKYNHNNNVIKIMEIGFGMIGVPFLICSITWFIYTIITIYYNENKELSYLL